MLLLPQEHRWQGASAASAATAEQRFEACATETKSSLKKATQAKPRKQLAIDAKSDCNSFGFIKISGFQLALGKLGQCLQNNPHNRIILDYDIKGIFDNISHE